MISSKNKKYLLMLFIIILVVLNIIQLNRINNYKIITRSNDMEFSIQLELICHGIETIEQSKVNSSADEKVLGIAILASATGQASSLCMQTSYYKQNDGLYPALWNLNNIISNNNRVNNIIEQNDFSTLIPIIKLLKENPLDKNATEKLHSYFRDIKY